MSGNTIGVLGSEAGIEGASLFHGDAHLAELGVHGQRAVGRVAESLKTDILTSSGDPDSSLGTGPPVLPDEQETSHERAADVVEIAARKLRQAGVVRFDRARHSPLRRYRSPTRYGRGLRGTGRWHAVISFPPRPSFLAGQADRRSRIEPCNSSASITR